MCGVAANHRRAALIGLTRRRLRLERPVRGPFRAGRTSVFWLSFLALEPLALAAHAKGPSPAGDPHAGCATHLGIAHDGDPPD